MNAQDPGPAACLVLPSAGFRNVAALSMLLKFLLARPAVLFGTAH